MNTEETGAIPSGSHSISTSGTSPTPNTQHPIPNTSRLRHPLHRYPAVSFIPLLFALYPVLSLYSLNHTEVPVRDLGRPILVALASTALLGILFRFVSRDRDPGRSALALSLFFLAFFLLDVAQLYLLSPLWKLLGILTEGGLNLVWQILCLLVVIWVLRARYPVNGVLPAATVAGMVLFAPPFCSTVWQGWRHGVIAPPVATVRTTKGIPAPLTPAHTSTLPDLYCIVLDAYGRQDVLERMYGVDNEPFLQELEKKGFFIARQSRANYIQTALAMDSALNGDYLKASDSQAIDDSVIRIGANRTTKILQKQGFRIVYVPTTYPLASLSSPDIQLDTQPPLTEIFTPLERLVLEKNPFAPLMVREYVAFDNHRLRLLAAMEDIKTAAKMSEPKFVLSHILAPHPPFVFGAKGEPVYPKQGIFKIGDATDYMNRSNPENYREGYANQVRYLNQKVLELVTAIQRENKRPAIIVLLGDHGPRSETSWKSLEKTNVREGFYNLVAIAAPGGKLRADLTDDLTPVNLLRLILTDVYGENLPRLSDKSYYSTLAYPYRFTEVTAQVAGAEAESRENIPGRK